MKLWIARDHKGTRLTLHSEKPTWLDDYRVWSKGYITDLPYDNYPEVTFENSPQEVELVIKK